MTNLLAEALRNLADVIEKQSSPQAPTTLKPLGSMRAAEAAEKLFGGISVEQLYRLANKGKVPAQKIDGIWIFNIAAVQEWQEKETSQQFAHRQKNKRTV